MHAVEWNGVFVRLCIFEVQFVSEGNVIRWDCIVNECGREDNESKLDAGHIAVKPSNYHLLTNILSSIITALLSRNKMRQVVALPTMLMLSKALRCTRQFRRARLTLTSRAA
jgi:hypothetical protein